MTVDYDDLRAKALAVLGPYERSARAWDEYEAAANPATVLSLLDEIAAQYRAGFTAGFEAAREAAAALLALSNEQLKLMAGEMTAQEVRTTQAVLKSCAAAIAAIPLPGGEK